LGKKAPRLCPAAFAFATTGGLEIATGVCPKAASKRTVGPVAQTRMIYR